MTTSEMIAKIRNGSVVPRGSACCCYEREGRHHRFRHCFLIYANGKILFQGLCYGESAGVGFALWSKDISPDGTITWELGDNLPTALDSAPKQITFMEDSSSILFDNKDEPWKLTSIRKSDKANGFSPIKVFLLWLLRK